MWWICGKRRRVWIFWVTRSAGSRDLYGRDRRYLNVEPSKKALQRERDRINEMTDRRQGCTPVPRLIERLNRQLKGWANYFSLELPDDAYRKINWHLGYRLANHLKHHRSQRPYQLPQGVTCYDHLQRLGLRFLRMSSSEPLTKVFRRAGCGKSARPVRRGRRHPWGPLLLYRPKCVFASYEPQWGLRRVTHTATRRWGRSSWRGARECRSRAQRRRARRWGCR